MESIIHTRPEFISRTARLSDIPELESLIEESVWALATEDYSKEQIEAALEGAWGVDTQLIKDETYFVIEHNNQMIACGGWSYRATLFGNDSEAGRDKNELNPNHDPAKIRAFFVHPSYARQGIGSLLLDLCEMKARDRGFSRLELMATLPGLRLYERHGFVAGEAIEYPLGNAGSITFVPMSKELEI